VLATAIVHIAEMGDADGHARPARRQQKEAAEQMEMGVHNVILLLGQKAPKVNEAAEQITLITLKRRMIHLPAQGGDLLFQRFGIAFRREKIEPDLMLRLQAGVNFYRAYLGAAALQRGKNVENSLAVHQRFDFPPAAQMVADTR
jgi:hypothetical protein